MADSVLTKKKSQPRTTKNPPTAVPSPELLAQYRRVDPELPALITREWGLRHRRAFVYALVATIGGILIAAGLIGGFVYLVMQGHPKSAATLLGGGALGMVAGFRAARLDS